jgi:hypothetical protein
MLCSLGCEFSVLTFANAQPITLKLQGFQRRLNALLRRIHFCVPVNESVNVAVKVTQVLGNICLVAESVQGRRIALKKQHGF